MFHVNVQSQLNCAGRKNSLVRKNSICEEDFLLGGRILFLWKNSAFMEEFRFYGRIPLLWKNFSFMEEFSLSKPNVSQVLTTATLFWGT